MEVPSASPQEVPIRRPTRSHLQISNAGVVAFDQCAKLVHGSSASRE
jgi:hypothetical protein